ncbi:MAG: hypothetical protein ACK4M7_11155 [Burkholderiales bacterium]
MRKQILNIGEKIFNVLVVVGFIAGIVSAIMSGMSVAAAEASKSAAWLAGISQLVLSWSGTLIIALIVYALLDIHHSLNKHDNK